MGLGEFEEAVGVLGVRKLVAIIRSKFGAGMYGVPLAQYAMQVLRIPTREVRGARGYLRPVVAQLGSEFENQQDFYIAKWP